MYYATKIHFKTMKCNGILLCLYIFFYVSATGQITLDFNNSPLTSSYEANYTYDSDSAQWHYSKAKSGTLSTNSPAICLGKYAEAHITSDTLVYGISSLSFFYEQAYSSNCEAYIFVNDSCLDTIATNNNQGTAFLYTSEQIYTYDSCIVSIKQSSGSSGQILIGNITYTKAWEPKIPFSLTSFSVSDTYIIAVFSDSIYSHSVYNLTGKIIEHTRATNDTIMCPLSPTLCGNQNLQFRVANIASEQIDTNIHFFRTLKPELHKIIITEIMCDPSPTIGLAEKEYIELYNRSNCPINLNSLKLAVNESTYHLPDFILNPEHHVCIYTSEFFTLENSNVFLSIPSIRALNNDGATIALLHGDSIISSVLYSKSWYQSTFKETGGWSLEKIQYDDCSETAANWKASQDYSGGTPGYINSVFNSESSVQYPQIISLKLNTDTCLQIQVSENCNPELLQFCILENNSITHIQSINHSLQQFNIFLEKPYSPQKEYSLQYSGIVNHNKIPVNWDYSFAMFNSLLERNAIVISEIVYNPDTEPGEFIELYNRSSYYYDLSEIFIARITTSDYSQIYPLAERPTLIKPHSFIVISTDSLYWKSISNCKSTAIFSELTNLPSFPNTEGNCVILNKWGEVIDSIWYTESMHNPDLLSTKGISLERISYANQMYSKTNWESANYFGEKYSPGCANSHGEEPRIHLQKNNTDTKFSIHSHTNISTITISTYNCLGILLTKKTIHPHSSFTEFSWNDSIDTNKKYNQGIYFTHITGILSNAKTFEKTFRIIED